MTTRKAGLVAITALVLFSGTAVTKVATEQRTASRTASRAPAGEPIASRSGVVRHEASMRSLAVADRGEPRSGGRELLEERPAGRSGVCGTRTTLQLYAKRSRRRLSDH